MSTEVAQRSPTTELVQTLRSDQFKSEVAIALPEDVTPARFVRIAVTALQASPDIIKCDRASILRSLLQSAAMGLLPDGREAALVPFKGNAQLIPMIAGFRKIAADYGWSLRTAVVYEGDEFEYELGAEQTLTHRPPRPGVDRGKPIAAYAVARHKDHPPEFEVMDAAEIEKVRQTSRAKDSGPWKDWWERMWEKTAGRRLFKKLPLGERDRARDERVARILAADETPPTEAATLVYGGDRRAIEGPARQAADDEAGAAAETPASTGEDGPASSEAAAPAETDFSDEPQPGNDEENPFEPPAGTDDERTEAAKAAGETLIPNGVHAKEKRTIAQVAELGADGEKWLLWALKKWAADSFREAVEAYVQVFLPDVWETYEAWKADQS